jgi:hypothetical protein
VPGLVFRIAKAMASEVGHAKGEKSHHGVLRGHRDDEVQFFTRGKRQGAEVDDVLSLVRTTIVRGIRPPSSLI